MKPMPPLVSGPIPKVEISPLFWANPDEAERFRKISARVAELKTNLIQIEREYRELRAERRRLKARFVKRRQKESSIG